MNAAPFFVVGVGRSGTTLLRMMLTHHPRLALPYESGFITAYHERASTFGSLADDAHLRRLVESMLGEPNVRRWDHVFTVEGVLARVRRRTVAGVVDAIYRDYAEAKGKTRWGDKSDYLDRMHVLHQMFPTAKYVHIIRDGRDVALSVLKLPWGPNDVVRAAEWWDSHVWLARRIGAVLGPDRYTEVRYEQLVAAPADALARICAFLGEQYSPQMLDYAAGATSAIPVDTRTLHHGVDTAPYQQRVSAWKREMHPADLALFNRHAGRMLTEAGYEVPPPAVGLPRLAIRYLTLVGRRLLEASQPA